MAKKSVRSVSRKLRRTDKRKTTHQRKTVSRRDKRRTKRRGGAESLDGAPVNYHLSGSWPSRMSLGQGADYFKYHEGQHGGALSMGPYPAAVLSPGLPQDLRGPAHIGGIDKAIADVRGLSDAPNSPNTVGGKRSKSRRNKSKKAKKNRTKKAKKAKKGDKRRTKRDKRDKRRKRRGGSLGYAPFPSSGMLLDSSKAYAQAGLNPEWKTDVAFTDAKIRDTQ